MKKVLIFGSTGTIGSYLAEDLNLSSDFEVIVANRSNRYDEHYDKQGIKHIYVDLTKPETFDNLPQTGIDAVVLLSAYLPAGMQGYHPAKYIEVNTSGALNVLEYCRKTNVKQIIYPQSHSDVYGHWGNGIIDPYADRKLNYNDDHTVYVISKVAAQELIHHYHVAYGLSYAIFRCPNIYAYLPIDYYYVNGIKKDIAYRKLIKKAINSEDIEIWGKCDTPRDIVYVKDFIQMIKLAINKEITNSIYNVSNGVSVTLDEQIKAIIDVFSPDGKKSKIIYKPEIEIVDRAHRYSIENAISELGYKPKYFLKEMFEDMKFELENKTYDFMAEN